MGDVICFSGSSLQEDNHMVCHLYLHLPFMTFQLPDAMNIV